MPALCAVSGHWGSGSAFVAAPVQWITGNNVLALNTVALLSVMLCGLGAFVLARRIGIGPAGAVVAGVIFAFSPPRFFRTGQLHLTRKARRDKHDHLRLMLDDGRTLVYHDPRRFGRWRGGHQACALVSPTPSRLSTQRPQRPGCAGEQLKSARQCQHRSHLVCSLGVTVI